MSCSSAHALVTSVCSMFGSVSERKTFLRLRYATSSLLEFQKMLTLLARRCCFACDPPSPILDVCRIGPLLLRRWTGKRMLQRKVEVLRLKCISIQKSGPFRHTLVERETRATYSVQGTREYANPHTGPRCLERTDTSCRCAISGHSYHRSLELTLNVAGEDNIVRKWSLANGSRISGTTCGRNSASISASTEETTQHGRPIQFQPGKASLWISTGRVFQEYA